MVDMDGIRSSRAFSGDELNNELLMEILDEISSDNESEASDIVGESDEEIVPETQVYVPNQFDNDENVYATHGGSINEPDSVDNDNKNNRFKQ